MKTSSRFNQTSTKPSHVTSRSTSRRNADMKSSLSKAMQSKVGRTASREKMLLRISQQFQPEDTIASQSASGFSSSRVARQTGYRFGQSERQNKEKNFRKQIKMGGESLHERDLSLQQIHHQRQESANSLFFDHNEYSNPFGKGNQTNSGVVPMNARIQAVNEPNSGNVSQNGPLYAEDQQQLYQPGQMPSTQQLQMMSVDEILNFHKQKAIQDMHNQKTVSQVVPMPHQYPPPQMQSMQQPQMYHQQSQNVDSSGYISNMSRKDQFGGNNSQASTGVHSLQSNDQLIENKVFSMLNSYFANALQTKQSEMQIQNTNQQQQEPSQAEMINNAVKQAMQSHFSMQLKQAQNNQNQNSNGQQQVDYNTLGVGSQTQSQNTNNLASALINNNHSQVRSRDEMSPNSSTEQFLARGGANFQTRQQQLGSKMSGLVSSVGSNLAFGNSNGVQMVSQGGGLTAKDSQNQFELDEIKATTQGLTHELGSMRRLIEDLHISVNEKDAEIIRLRMHLGDERTRQSIQGRQLRKDASQNSLLNQSNATSASKANGPQDSPKNSHKQADLSETKEFENKQDDSAQVRYLKEQLRDTISNAREQSSEQHTIINDLKQDCLNMQEEVQKALKIHRANKELNQKNQTLKKEMQRLTHEHKTEIEQNQAKIDLMTSQIDQLKLDLRRKTEEKASVVAQMSTVQVSAANSSSDGGRPCKGCLEGQSQREALQEQLREVEGQLRQATHQHEDQLDAVNHEKRLLQERFTAIKADLDATRKELQEIKTNQNQTGKGAPQSDKLIQKAAQEMTQVKTAQLQAQFDEEKQAIQAKHALQIQQNLQESKSKDEAVAAMSEQLQQIQSERDQLKSQVEGAKKGEREAKEKLQKEVEQFARMGESLGVQAQEKAMLKVEVQQLKGELMMCEQELQVLRKKKK